ncbi:putative SET domain-containing protein [Phytophthora cinnamomi]|uniref:putative SET domain-containing protein n=1 Tax=Phytophthora cinnamomi TaxID=4785 RepID=UPI00355AC88D|nr:putative SET domain-containing protein [Phytophthora cinnamomi]
MSFSGRVRDHKRSVLSRKEPPEIPYCHCAARTDWRETCGPGCENRARMQRGDHAAMGLKPIEGKGISLVTDVAIAKDDLVAQYVGSAAFAKHEITISYGFKLSTDKEKIKCLCGSSRCRG